MRSKPVLLSIALCAIVSASGCATNRSYMRLSVIPVAPVAQVEHKKSSPYIVIDVSDERHFEEAPSDPSIPSLKKGDDYKLDAEQRKRAIARKRNSWGRAIGDILLEDNETVEMVTRDLISNGLAQRGYFVLPLHNAPVDATHLHVAIREFWAWLTPGMWTVDMEAKIDTVLEFSTWNDGKHQVEIAAYGKKSAPTGAEDNWRQAYDRAFADYAAKLASALEGAGM